MRADTADQMPVRRPAASQYHAVRQGRQMELIVQRDRTRGEFREGGKSVLRRQLRYLAPNHLEKRFAEQLAPGAFGGWRVKERLFEPTLINLLLRLAARGQGAVPINRPTAGREPAHGQIDQDIGRSGVEREQFGFSSAAPVNRS